MQITNYKSQLISLTSLLAFSLAFSTASQAAYVHSAVSVTTEMGNSTGGNSNINHIIDQSGLSSTYTSGATDFDTYVNSNPTHTAFTTNVDEWQSSGTTTGNIDFDLGSSLTVSGMAMWFTTWYTAVAIKSFTLYADDEATFTNATNLGDFTNTIFGDASVQVFNFSDTDAQFIRMQITDNNGYFSTNHAEVAFDAAPVSAVPVPAAVWLFGSALMGLVGLRKKKA